MGGVIIDGRAALKFKGSLAKFEKAIVALSKFQKQIDGLKIDTVPLPERAGICVEMKFSGTISQFEKLLTGLKELKDKVAIDTVPLPEIPAIGTWPTPETPSKPLSWIIWASPKLKRK